MVAACGRSPLREDWASILEHAPRQALRSKPLGIRTLVIPSTYGTRLARRIPRQFPSVDAWSIPVHRAVTLAGRFRSTDMKDYLGLGANQRLILSTAGPDDYQEMLWKLGDSLDYRGHGIDFWFPGHFSIYDGDSKFYQLFNAKRQQMHARLVASQFMWFRLGEHATVDWLGVPPDFPSVLMSTQQMFSNRARRVLRSEVAVADAYFDPEVEFYFVGSSALVSVSSARQTHEIRSDWLHRGLAGADLKGQRDLERSREEMLVANLRGLLARSPRALEKVPGTEVSS